MASVSVTKSRLLASVVVVVEQFTELWPEPGSDQPLHPSRCGVFGASRFRVLDSHVNDEEEIGDVIQGERQLLRQLSKGWLTTHRLIVSSAPSLRPAAIHRAPIS